MTAPKTAQATSSMVCVAVALDAVHPELREYPQWVVWTAEPKEDGQGFDKVPYNVRTGRKASHSDSRTWASFEEVAAAYVRDGWDGIGFVLSSGDPFSAIDLDRARDPETGELSEWAQKILEALDGYVEISPSGRGLHIFVKGWVASKKGDRLEVYSQRRFITMTGVRL